jgi:hypothetical protein
MFSLLSPPLWLGLTFPESPTSDTFHLSIWPQPSSPEQSSAPHFHSPPPQVLTLPLLEYWSHYVEISLSLDFLPLNLGARAMIFISLGIYQRTWETKKFATGVVGLNWILLQIGCGFVCLLLFSPLIFIWILLLFDCFWRQSF